MFVNTDFAFSNKIEIVFNDSHEEPLRGDGTETCEADRVKLLRDIIKAVIANIEKVGKDVSKAEIEMLVKACLKKLGCSIN